MNKDKIISIMVSHSIEWNKEETQDRAFIYVDDFINELLYFINKQNTCQCCDKNEASICNSCMSGIAQDTASQAMEGR